jgi:hypothetical protein
MQLFYTNLHKVFHIGFMQTSIKPMWNILIVNCVTNICIWNTCVIWQGIDYKLFEDDTIVSKHVAVW